MKKMFSKIAGKTQKYSSRMNSIRISGDFDDFLLENHSEIAGNDFLEILFIQKSRYAISSYTFYIELWFSISAFAQTGQKRFYLNRWNAVFAFN